MRFVSQKVTQDILQLPIMCRIVHFLDHHLVEQVTLLQLKHGVLAVVAAVQIVPVEVFVLLNHHTLSALVEFFLLLLVLAVTLPVEFPLEIQHQTHQQQLVILVVV